MPSLIMLVVMYLTNQVCIITGTPKVSDSPQQVFFSHEGRVWINNADLTLHRSIPDYSEERLISCSM